MEETGFSSKIDQNKKFEVTKVKSLEILARNTPTGKYYEIKYVKCSDGKTYIGYSSHNILYLLQWIAECFEIMPQEVK